jgi:predicted unusual protein kinase regulating ubiquinone biosynthesis (AarF/ABC1/UbiB family)
VGKVFGFLLTVFLLIRRKERLGWYRPLEPDALRIRITELGASFIKLAQVLATRADFFDDRYLAQLRQLHDEIPPMGESAFRRVYGRAFEGESPFASFEELPIASASIGQVHRARLRDGTEVAVKLRREGIEAQVEADLRILEFFNRLFRPLFSTYTRNSVDAVISEFGRMIREEVNLATELGNLKSFSSAYARSGIRFPRPYERWCSEDALVMSYEEGIRFDDRAGMERLGIDFHRVMGELIRFYTEQMLVQGYFHADPHPGNLLIRPDGQLVLLDFGMVKRIANPTRVAIIEMVKSAHEQDFDLYISACKRLGIIAYEAPMDRMTELASRMFEIFNDESLDAMTMQELAFGVMASMRDFPFKLPQEAVYILRASAIIEGLGTVYIENFNGIKDILPVLQSNIPRALGTDRGPLELIREEFHAAPLRIKQLHQAIQKASEDELRVHLSERQLEWLEAKMDRRLGRLAQGAVLMGGGIFLLLVDPTFKGAALMLFLLGAWRMTVR